MVQPFSIPQSLLQIWLRLVCLRLAYLTIVKIRRGRRQDEEVAPRRKKLLAPQAAGASAVAIHGACHPQMYRGQAEWETVNRVCDAVSIPVIGSGDMLSAEAAAHARHKNRCDNCSWNLW